MSTQMVKIIGQRSRSQRLWPLLAVSGPLLQFQFTYADEMMHKAWCCLEEVPYCFSRSSAKFVGHTGQKIADFDRNWAFPDGNSSLNSHMAMKWCIKLDVVFSRSSGKFQGHTAKKHHQFDPNWAFLDCNSSLKKHRRGVPLFFKVIRQISRSHETKNYRFWPELSVSGL